MRKSLVIIMIFFSMSIMCFANGKEKPLIEDGILDLSNWSFDDGTISLDGQWKYYPNQFIPPMYANTDDLSCGLINVPSVWEKSNFEINGEKHKLQKKGHGTYTLRIILNEDIRSLSIKIPTIGTNYNFYINGELLASVGKIGTDKKSSLPAYKPQIINYAPNTNQLYVVFQVSNYNYYYGGIWYPIIIGNTSDIYKINDNHTIRYYMISGVLLIMAIMQMVLYLLRKKDKLSLVFSVLCIIIWIRLSTNNDVFILSIFSNLSFDIIMKLEYLTYYICVPMFAAFLYFAFSNYFSKRILKAMTIIGGVFSLIVICTPAYFYPKTLVFYQIFTVVGIIYGMYIIFLTFIKKEKDAAFLIIGVIVVFFTVLNDILYANQIIKTGYWIDFGILTIIISQSILINYRYMKAFETINSLSVNLENKNRVLQDLTKNLEVHVEKRTFELQKAYKEIENLALTDALTGLLNRHALQKIISIEENECLSSGNTFFIAILDIDDFKRINDTYGHDVGDKVLVKIAEIAKKSIRVEDNVARWGGEEFLLLITKTNYEEAEKIVERVRKNIEESSISIKDKEIFVTVTIGLSRYNVKDGQLECFKQADKALYYGKENGKNRVVSFEKLIHI